jgi:hypothetical protein
MLVIKGSNSSIKIKEIKLDADVWGQARFFIIESIGLNWPKDKLSDSCW